MAILVNIGQSSFGSDRVARYVISRSALRALRTRSALPKLPKITPKNLNTAHHYLNIASDRDNYRAQLLLGHLHANGLGAPASPAKAVDQIRYAAMQGSPQAACLMFLCFYDGFGVRRNRQLALGWLQNAADFGSADAKNILKHAPNSIKFQENVDLLRKKLDFFPKNH